VLAEDLPYRPCKASWRTGRNGTPPPARPVPGLCHEGRQHRQQESWRCWRPSAVEACARKGTMATRAAPAYAPLRKRPFTVIRERSRPSARDGSGGGQGHRQASCRMSPAPHILVGSAAGSKCSASDLARQAARHMLPGGLPYRPCGAGRAGRDDPYPEVPSRPRQLLLERGSRPGPCSAVSSLVFARYDRKVRKGLLRVLPVSSRSPPRGRPGRRTALRVRRSAPARSAPCPAQQGVELPVGPGEEAVLDQQGEVHSRALS
jgi:hypothetical protein